MGLLRRGGAALTDDGLPPLAAAGLKLHDQLSRIAASLDHMASLVGGLPGDLSRLQQLLRRGLEETSSPVVGGAGGLQMGQARGPYPPELRRGGPAEDEQRPGAHLRQPSLPRASVQRSAAVLAGSGRDGPGAGDLGLGDAAPARRKAWCCVRAMWRAGKSCERSWRARGAAEAAALPPRPGPYLAKLEQHCLQLNLPS